MRGRGFTLIELLVAVVLLGVAIAGLISLWSFAYNTSARSGDVGVTYSVARQEIEKWRGMGYMRLPLPDSGTLKHSWTVGYDSLGSFTTEANPHYTATDTVTIIPLATGETDDNRCLRSLTVEVTARDRSEPMFITTTYFTEGGV